MLSRAARALFIILDFSVASETFFVVELFFLSITINMYVFGYIFLVYSFGVGKCKTN